MPERILVVDDEPNMLRLLQTILTGKTGYEVVTTNNPLEVGKLLQEESFDLVITDLKMPLVDGMDLIDIIKKIDVHLPIIIITAYGTTETAEEAVTKGAYDFHHQTFPQRDHPDHHQAGPGVETAAGRTGGAERSYMTCEDK